MLALHSPKLCLIILFNLIFFHNSLDSYKAINNNKLKIKVKLLLLYNIDPVTKEIYNIPVINLGKKLIIT